MTPPSEEPRAVWLSLGNLLPWAWPRTFSPPGIAIVLVCCVALSFLHVSLLNKPWSIGFVVIAAVVLAIGYVLLTVVAIIGEVFAEWLTQRLFTSPNPKNPMHQFVHFVVSCIGVVLGAVVVLSGDSDSFKYGRP